MKSKEYRPYAITVTLSGRTHQLENKNSDNTYTFCPRGNKRTSEKSAIAAVKQTVALCGCKVEKIVKIEKLEV